MQQGKSVRQQTNYSHSISWTASTLAAMMVLVACAVVAISVRLRPVRWTPTIVQVEPLVGSVSMCLVLCVEKSLVCPLSCLVNLSRCLLKDCDLRVRTGHSELSTAVVGCA